MWNTVILLVFVFVFVFRIIKQCFSFNINDSVNNDNVVINNYTTEQHLHVDEKFMNER